MQSSPKDYSLLVVYLLNCRLVFYDNVAMSGDTIMIFDVIQIRLLLVSFFSDSIKIRSHLVLLCTNPSYGSHCNHGRPQEFFMGGSFLGILGLV